VLVDDLQNLVDVAGYETVVGCVGIDRRYVDLGHDAVDSVVSFALSFGKLPTACLARSRYCIECIFRQMAVAVTTQR